MEYLSPREGGPLQSAIFCALLPSKNSRFVRLFGCGVFALTTLAAPAAVFANAPQVPMVRVLVEREPREIKIHGFDLVISEAATGKKLAHSNGSATIPVRCSLGGRMQMRSASLYSFENLIRISATAKGEKGGIDLAKVPDGILSVNGPLHIESLGGFIRVGASQYRDDLYLYSFNGDCVVVNHVDLEKYVAGLLNSEMSAKWSSETLKAQAIAARTYAIYQMQESSTVRYRGLASIFDLEATVKDQVYEGANQERYKALRAVHETRGQILTFDGKPIKAFYHSTCGGHTEDPQKVWGVKYPYLKPVTCGYCNRSPRYNWALTLSAAEVERKLASQKLLKGNLVSMRVLTRNSLGRVASLEVTGTKGVTTVAGTKFRDLLGTAQLRSTDFTVTQGPASRLTFNGHGSGHGVGMCQWGAKAMGDKGIEYTEILKHYYPEALLTRLY